MYLQKKSAGGFVFGVLLIASILFPQLPVVYAEDSSSHSPVNNLCPIIGTYGAIFLDNRERYDIEDVFSNKIILNNQSDFTLSGVRVAVVAYGGDGKPAYWTVLPDIFHLSPRQTNTVAVDLDLSYVAAGKYTLKPSVIQGTEAELLGASLRDHSNQPGVNIIKITPKENDASIFLTINEIMVEGEVEVLKSEPLSVKIQTKNNNDKPLLNSHMVGVITEGSIPLGPALIAETKDSLKLMPGSTRDTALAVGGFDYHELTLYAGLVTEGALQPIKATKIKTDAEPFAGVWPYISRLGVSSIPLKTGSAVVACVDYLGLDSGTAYTPLAVDFELSSTEGEILTKERITNLEENVGKTFSLISNQDLINFNISATLLEYNAKAGPKPVGEYESLEAHIEDNFYEARETNIDFVCNDPNLCGELADETGASFGDGEGKNNFWFYVAIVLVVCLLMYLMLLRLPPGKVKPEEEETDIIQSE